MTEKIKIITLRVESLLTCAVSLFEYTKKYGEWQIKVLGGVGVNDVASIKNPYVIALVPNANTWYVLGAQDEGNKIFLFAQESDAKLFLDKLADLVDNGKYKIGYSA